MPSRIGHERLRRVEPHRLRGEQPCVERRGVVHLEPRARVDEVGERVRVRLREPEVRERLQLVEDLLPHLGPDPLGRHAGQQPRVQRLHLLGRPLRAHRAPQLVRLGTREVGDVDRHLHELLLEERHAERLGQRLLEQRMEVGDLLATLGALDVRVDRPALDRPRTDQRDLDDDVVERAGAQAGQRRHLGPRLDLEHPDRVRRAQQVVDERVLLRQTVQVELDPLVLPDQGEPDLQRREHAEAEQVELHQAGVGAVVLVPLQHGASGHPGPLHGADLDHRPVAQHHAAGVDTEVPRQVQESFGQIEHVPRDLVEIAGRGGPVRGDDVVPVGGEVARPLVTRAGRPEPGLRSGTSRLRSPAQAPPAFDALAPGILLPDVVPQRAGGVAHRGAGAVGDDVGDLRRVRAPVLGVDVLDDLLPATGLDVHVDVGRPVALGREEPLEEQAVPHRVDGRDPERVADRRVRRRPPPLAQDAVLAAELDQVVDDQEVPREGQRLDDVELASDLRVGARNPLRVARTVPPCGAAPGQLAQPGGFCMAGRDGVGRKLRRHQVEVERALVSQLSRRDDRLRVTHIPGQHLGRRPQVGPAGRGQPAVEVVERRPRPHRGERPGQVRIARRRVVHVAGRDER